MATRTFSGRASDSSLAYADALTREQHGMSFGQYCSSLLLESIERAGELPSLASDAGCEQKMRALSVIKAFPKAARDTHIGFMSDEQVKDLIASRYE